MASKQFDEKQQNIRRVSLVTSIKQVGLGLANAFNSTGSIMVAACNNDIKVWKFIGQPKQIKKLKGHQDLIYCIVFSKKNFWFASGALDKNIIFCNENFIGANSEQLHSKGINHLLLNKAEDELISCSGDKTIKIWKINSQQMEYEYELEKKHLKTIFYVSMNESETYLVSCSKDKKIILWFKYNNRWQYQNEIQNQELGYKLSFIGETFCAWQHHMDIVTEIFEVQNGQLLRRPDLKFIINRNCFHDNQLFPSIYNSKKQIVVQSHERHICFLKIQDDKKLKLIYNIDCDSVYNCGTLTQNWEFLVVWNEAFGYFRIFKIQ